MFFLTLRSSPRVSLREALASTDRGMAVFTAAVLLPVVD